MKINIPVLLAAGFGLLAIAATSFSSNSAPKLPLRITHDAASRAVNLGFEANDIEKYYLLEGRTDLDTGDWSLSYGIKGDGHNQSHPMPMITNKGFYRLMRVPADDPVLEKDYDGDRAILRDELDRGLDGFETVPADSDGDKIPNDWEAIHGLDPNDATDAGSDADNDMYSNLEEYMGGTDPDNPDETPAEEGESRFIAEIYTEEHSNHNRAGTYAREITETYTYTDSPKNGKTTTGKVNSWQQIQDETPIVAELDLTRTSWYIASFRKSEHDYKVYERRRETLLFEHDGNESGHYRLKDYTGSENSFIILHTKFVQSQKIDECTEGILSPGPDEVCETSSHYEAEDPTTYQFEVVHWDGKQLTIDGAPVSLPTQKRGCKFAYGSVKLPYPVKLEVPEATQDGVPSGKFKITGLPDDWTVESYEWKWHTDHHPDAAHLPEGPFFDDKTAPEPTVPKPRWFSTTGESWQANVEDCSHKGAPFRCNYKISCVVTVNGGTLRDPQGQLGGLCPLAARQAALPQPPSPDSREPLCGRRRHL